MSVFASKAQGHPADVMPWGRHKGTPVKEVPKDYLRWALANASILSDELRAAMEAELGIAPREVKPAEKGLINELRAAMEAELGIAPGEVKPAEKGLINELRDLLADTRRKLKAAEEESRGHQQRIGALEAALNSASRETVTDGEAFRRIVKQWFGAMSRKYHPDMGGSAEKQAVVNACYQDLIKRLEGEACGATSYGPNKSRPRPQW